jgi:hypothetical protein
VVIVQLIAELVALLAAHRAQRVSSPLFRLQRESELHLLPRVLLLAVMADVVLNSAMRCVIPTAHMAVVARKQNTIIRL